MHRYLTTLCVFSLLVFTNSNLSNPCFGEILGWEKDAGEVRQVVAVTSTVPRENPVVELKLTGPADCPLKVVTKEEPRRLLPVFQKTNGVFCVSLPGHLQPGGTRYLIATWSKADGWSASPRLSQCPMAGDDYATLVAGDAWDFNEGDTEAITVSHEGNQDQYGPIRVQDGMLILPVRGDDPYFTWGTMFGPSNPAKDLRIDSGLYTTLSMRIRQSCEDSKWTFYLTDAKGGHQKHDFEVHGKDFQTLTFDLKKLFENFWDGRQFRALRIDTTDKQPGVTVEVDWIQLTRPSVQVDAGPVLSADEVARRSTVKKLRVECPSKVTVGEQVSVKVIALDDQGKPVKDVPVAVALHIGDRLVTSCVSKSDVVTVDVGTQAATATWTMGLCDEMGRPAGPVQQNSLAISPAALDHYELTPAKEVVPVTEAEVKLSIWGVDCFGNPIPVHLQAPQWEINGGGSITPGQLLGEPASVTIKCADRPRVVHDIVLRDAKGHEGHARVMTLALKDQPTQINSNGFFVDSKGELYMPLGGFYVNWPAALPKPNGAISRSMDLFPCNALPYRYGFPWSDDVEKKVVDYLQLCHKHGVTGLRLMLRNMDIVGRVDPVQLKAVLHLLDLAKPLGIKFNIVLLEDYNKAPYVNLDILDKIVLPHYTEAELKTLPPHRARFLVSKEVLPKAAMRYEDQGVIRCQKEYLAELLPYLSDREEVFCYEFENEMVYPPMSWVNEMAAFIRAIDPKTPILGNPGPHDWPEPWRWRGSNIDLYSYHPYNNGLPEADHGAVIFMRSKWSSATGFPMFTGEGGINQSRWSSNGVTIKKAPQDCATRGIRDQIWLSIGCGANGAFMWTSSHETEMAEFGKVLPALKAVGIDLHTIKRRRPRTVLVMPENQSANNRACVIGYQLLDRGVDFDTRPADAAEDYKFHIDAATVDLKQLEVMPEFLEPMKGYQITYLASENLDQVLVYLRNTAGGIHNHGVVRPCHLREPQPAQAGLKLVGPTRWTQVKAFDLDASTPVSVQVDGNTLRIDSDTTHDYVIGLKR